jgi:hypothetical protein
MLHSLEHDLPVCIFTLRAESLQALLRLIRRVSGQTHHLTISVPWLCFLFDWGTFAESSKA